MESENLSGPSSPELEIENRFSEYPERPILFVGMKEIDKFCMPLSAIDMLRSFKEPVALVSLCGLSHRGKSFLLNQGPHSIEIVSLAVHLSSMFIYNQMGSIDDVALHLLYRVIERTKDIHLQATQAGDTTSMPEPRSPILLLLLRDFHLGLVEDKHLIAPQEHLANAVRRVEPAGNDVETARNKSVRAFFPDTEYFSLVHPAGYMNDLVRLDQISIDGLRPEFRDGIATLKTFILERTRPKQVGNTMMTGPMFVRITQMFLDTINNGPAPSSWQNKEENIYLNLYSLIESVFMMSVNDVLLGEVSKGLLVKKLAKLMSVFDNQTAYAGLGNGPLHEIYRMCLKSGLEKKIMELVEAAAELVAHGNLANEKVGVVLGKFVGCPGSSFPRTSGLGIGSVSTHCEELLSSGLQSRRKKINDQFQQESIGDGITDDEGMGFDSPCNREDGRTRGDCRMSKTKEL